MLLLGESSWCGQTYVTPGLMSPAEGRVCARDISGQGSVRTGRSHRLRVTGRGKEPAFFFCPPFQQWCACYSYEGLESKQSWF